MSITLISKEGAQFLVSKPVADRIGVVRDCAYGADFWLGYAVATDDSMGITLANVTSSILSKILVWCEHYKDMEPLVDGDSNMEFPEWDMAYIGHDMNQILFVLEAADYLHIPGLLLLACKGIADVLDGRNPRGICDLLGIVMDFSHRQEVDMDKENGYWRWFLHPT
ncbi:hypothetical protein CALVIDRAFT_530474 [Calocera viscosa TUFC12733]|uniref:E3 ubiquitin ligase complex SCF subunit n=1 Tax=Calocera viscosa (strain TUFC12733) TaxID=1330018 RepID=A0A167HR40_CALVF|nr:hypothetical protein CALVIDRAFT_530474 [Calocera viscosa TUFC12733]